MLDGGKLSTKASLVGLALLFVTSFAQAKPSTALQLNQQEQSYLDGLDAIPMCTDPDWMPYEAINKSGKQIGIMSDFYKLWSQKIGKPVKLIPTTTWLQTLKYFKAGKCLLLSSAQQTPERKSFLMVTQPFITYAFAIATQPDTEFIVDMHQVLDKQFVMVAGYAGIDIMRNKYPNIHIKTVSSAEQGLKMVEKGKAFGFIDTVPSINYQMLEHGISYIKLSGVLDEHYSMSVGVRVGQPLLLSIFNKVIASTTDTERQRILKNWLSVDYDYRFNYKLMWQALAVLSVLLICLFIRYRLVHKYNRKLQKVNRQLEYLSHNDHLSGLPNRYLLHKTFQLEVARSKRNKKPFSVMMMDVDWFKRINDSYGHDAGDDVIKKMAFLLLSNIRENDAVGRWGGEEFLIICPETGDEGAFRLGEHLRQQVEQYDFGVDLPLTVSVGIAEFRLNETMESCLKRADTALYQAKHTGRNKTIVAE